LTHMSISICLMANIHQNNPEILGVKQILGNLIRASLVIL
jgi:hypothetical protein